MVTTVFSNPDKLKARSKFAGDRAKKFERLQKQLVSKGVSGKALQSVRSEKEFASERSGEFKKKAERVMTGRKNLKRLAKKIDKLAKTKVTSRRVIRKNQMTVVIGKPIEQDNSSQFFNSEMEEAKKALFFR